MRHIEAIVFDMDGVLVDAREWHFLALNKALGLFGYTISPEEHKTDFDGLPTRRKLEILSSRNGLPLGMHDFINELKQKYTVELIHEFCRPSFQHQYTLKQLKIEKYRLGLASNSIMATITLMMEKTALSEYLDVVVSAENVTQGKPSPEIYQKIFSDLKLEACQVVVVEDNENGIKAASLSGAHVFEVEDPSMVSIDLIRTFINKIEDENCKQ